MLPLRLELSNFLAYRNPDPLLLENLHLACLSGPNGAGKSTLLDAITWALWGKARARSDDDLIHIGQAEMSVTLDFVQESQRYRVIRKRKLGTLRKDGGRAPGQSTLDLFSWDAGRNVFSLINEPTIRETQTRINNLLHLDYEIFCHSAFLQQGKADVFTTKTPAQRKDILSNILGLDRWAMYEEKTRDLLKNIQGEMAVLSTRIAEMEGEIAEEPGLQDELEVARGQLAEAQAEVERAETSLAEMRGADIELRAAQEALASIETSIKERDRDIRNEQDQIARYEDQLVVFQAVLTESERIKEGYALLEQARAADMALGSKLAELNDLNQHINGLERQLEEVRQEIVLELRHIDTAIQKDMSVQQAGDAVMEQLTDLDFQIQEMEALEAEREGWQALIVQHKEEIADLTARNTNLRLEMDDIKQRLTMLEATTGALCPVCGQPLDEEHRLRLQAETSTQGRERGDSFRANKNRVESLNGEIQTLQKDIKEAERQLKTLPTLRGQRGGYEQQILSAQQAASRIQAGEVRREELVLVLEEGRFAEALRGQIKAAYAEREALGYDRDAHVAVREQMDTYLTYQERARELDLALQSTPLITESLNNARKRRERYEKSLSEAQTQAETQKAEIERLQIKVIEMQRRQTELTRQRTLQRNVEEKVISLEQSLRSIARLRERRAEMIERRAVLGGQENTYEQLKNAFGRNGIPAMMIEAAIPELEDAANRLLARMTNNRMHLRFDTQREKKTGGVTETLDILIADELGTRDYSMFSGGEAFRVNFAIRIALSQLLARRAGAQLRTLFIDEGFGTQDDIGRERLVEAITAIQDDFDLLLVITHIDELKDAFPARIEVNKTPNGSFAVIR